MLVGSARTEGKERSAKKVVSQKAGYVGIK